MDYGVYATSPLFLLTAELTQRSTKSSRSGPRPNSPAVPQFLGTICLLYTESNCMPTRSIERRFVQGPSRSCPSGSLSARINRRRMNDDCARRPTRVGFAEIIAGVQRSRL